MTIKFLTEDITDSNPLSDLVGLPMDEFTSKADERGIYVVGHHDIVTDDIKSDMSRFFPTVDDNDVVTGGSFQ